MNWDVDVFRFTKATGDNPLICSTYIIFQQRRLFTSMNIRPRSFVNFITAIQVSLEGGGEGEGGKGGLMTTEWGSAPVLV